MNRRWLSTPITLLAAMIAGQAAATETSPGFFGAAVSGVAGVGTPVGLLGVEGRLDLLPCFYLTAGLGLNPSPQIAGMAHLRLPLPRDTGSRLRALSAGYGVSYGKHEWSDLSAINFDQESEYRARKEGLVWWHNVQVDFEIRIRGERVPVLIDFFGGVAVAGNPEALHCIGNEIGLCETRFASSGGGPLPYAGASLGFWLD